MTFPRIFDGSNGGMIPIGGFVDLETFLKPTFDFKKLAEIVKVMTINLNNIIDYNYYLDKKPETKTSNLRHRPIG